MDTQEYEYLIAMLEEAERIADLDAEAYGVA